MPFPPMVSKSQINRLGDRLRAGDTTESDLRLLDDYRRSFAQAYEDVVGRIREQLNLEPTGRPTKSTNSIIDKLRREKTRLTTMQDIAGCRLVVENLVTQDEVLYKLSGLFDKCRVDDRRERPSHGYRAVHVIVETGGKLIEIQVRTILQHAWAELSQKLSDVIDPAIKYGGGDPELVSLLAATSLRTMHWEIAVKSRNLEAMPEAFQRFFQVQEQLFDATWLRIKK